ncbi:MAG: UDP-glucose 6-dehydrogenase [Candidatus Buchananbacteria bacterium RIFCSPHIGHO2_01_FULL_44_11]|uniref:UDP-glucose 6-dehydrogenase n=1 Tax=Candidatus Buchananbacteria bacterium RIFCSPHIGHO2_01_FULL_44_11 TaxID=1797535 RepID=A0A1G1Y3V9_9BACT|nr:MAG: UDP-glucose 6-dehydrogenase [Candidatus Buchananbacteria bacterium RIFCSPHIGHO2_01_FULL_44_11]
MKIAIIGTGYVGLTTGVCLADLGHQVVCIDHNPDKVARLKQGISPIFEPGIEDLIKKNLNKNLAFEVEIAPAVKNSEVIFICVNTPPKPNGQADLKYIEKAAREIAQFMNSDYKVIVDKSTVPVRTAEKVKETIMAYATEKTKFDVVSNPEFLREGSAIKDTLNPDRIVIGVDSDQAKEKMLEVYKPLIEKENSIVKIVSVRSAELIKHGANTFLATKISFANLMAETCEAAGADALEVLEAIGLDKRIGHQFLSPGIGFGGSCFPKDIAAYKKTLEILGIDYSFVSAVEEINRRAQENFLHKIEKELWVLDGKQIGILGLAFKPNTDDIRNAPALKIIEKLKNDGAKIKVYDPQAMANVKKLFSDIEYCDNPYLAAQDAEALLICTEWDEFKNLDLAKIKKIMLTPVIFDGRNIFNPQTVRDMGFKYSGIGRP